MNPEQLPLRDLHLPEPVGWWPPAPGWWLLAGVLVAAFAYYLWYVFRSWRLNAPRRAALAEYRRLSGRYAADSDAVALARSLSALLRRLMLAYASRNAVAGLTGRDWLRFLDRGLPQSPFTTGPGEALARLPYVESPAAAEIDVDGLLQAVRLRLQMPLPEERA